MNRVKLCSLFLVSIMVLMMAGVGLLLYATA